MKQASRILNTDQSGQIHLRKTYPSRHSVNGQTLIAELKRARSKSEASLRIPDIWGCKCSRKPRTRGPNGNVISWVFLGCSINRTLLQCPTIDNWLFSSLCICILYIYIYHIHAYLSVHTCHPFIPIIGSKDQNSQKKVHPADLRLQAPRKLFPNSDHFPGEQGTFRASLGKSKYQ